MGDNGTGKTTIFDAITWLLFGKNSEDKKEFGIKTKGKDGKVIEKLPHEVSAVLLVNDEEITLCRRLVEKWTKKRGSAEEVFTGNTEERLYNDVPCSVKEWSEKIDNICTEQVFKFITSPLYFNQQRPDIQRSILFRMAGDISDAEIAKDNEDFINLLDSLKGKTLDEYKKEIAAKKRRLKAEIDTIPERIDERKRDMPQESDWGSIEASIKEKKKRKEEIEAQKSDAAQAYAAANTERMELVKQIAELKQKRLSLEITIKNEVQKEYREQQAAKEDAVYKIGKLSKDVELEKKCIEDNKAKLDEHRAYREKLIKEWERIKSQTLSFNDEDFICPTCRRPFEPDEIEAKQREIANRFNECKAHKIDENVKVGKENKRLMQEIEAHIELSEKNILSKTTEIEEIKSSEAYNANPACPDATPIIEANAEYQSLSRQIEELEVKSNEQIVASDNLSLNEQCRQIERDIDELNAVLVNKDIIERNNARIGELERLLRTQSEELAQLEGIEFNIEAFTKARTEEIDKRINGMFRIVKFKMYESQINGGEVETCIATVDGIPYPDLNNAKRLYAGLDIINAICRYEGITVPIVIDNAEGINKIPVTISQQIRLAVSLDNELTIKDIQRNLFS